jgi:hypothetical protein
MENQRDLVGLELVDKCDDNMNSDKGEYGRSIESRMNDIVYETSLREVVDLSTNPFIQKKKKLFEKFYECLFTGRMLYGS